jgi:periplasmic protein TonB
MRTRMSYAVSAALHAGAFWALASADDLLRPEFAVRSGEAAPLVSASSRARSVVEPIDSRLDPDPRATIEIAAPEIPSVRSTEPPVMPPTSADLDHRVVIRPPIEEPLRRRTERSVEVAMLPQADPLPVERPETTPETDGRATPPLFLTVPDQEAPSPDRIQPHRPVVAARPVQAAEVVDPGDAAMNAVGAKVDQGAKVDRLPSTLPINPEPPYPEELRRQRIGGQVVLWLAIAADGSVAEVRVDKSSGYAALDESAVTTVRRWRFDPARRSGQPVRFEVRLPVTFSVRKG